VKKNLGTVDRLVRAIVAELCILLAFFWAGREWEIPLYLIAVVMLFQAVTGTCGAYRLLGRNSCEMVKRKDKNLVRAFALAAVILAAAGIYASAVLTSNIFQEDLGRVDVAYSSALQSAGAGQRQEAVQQYGRLESAFADFQEKYSAYRPLAVKFDRNFTGKMDNISAAIASANESIILGNLTRGHEMLQRAGPALQELKKSAGCY
jgi:hypothetical protein